MNVACPTCATTYRVDPAKIPGAGVRARCQVCAAVFPISANGTAPRPSLAAPVQRPAIPTGLRPSGTMAAPAMPPAPPAAPAAPPRPTAPPVAAPVAPPAAPKPPIAPAPAPAPVAAPAPVPAPKPAAPAGRPLNPFLANDPATRARRLARALVSDLVVYNTARRDTALKGGTLKEEFAEEIKKSFEEYELQIGKELASSTTYFNDALNEILAGGQKIY
ncbi:MAG: zinc-ribbon domain-containing protein [Gemmatimonadota bacterium]